jgi:hypothetical protein
MSVRANKIALHMLLFANLGFALPNPALADSITAVTSSVTNGSYKTGAVIVIDVTFSEDVIVTGTPRLTLETGAVDAAVSYSAGSGSPTIQFTYIVAAGHTTADLDYVSASALALNGGTIKNRAGTPVSLTLPSPGAAGSLGASKKITIDTTLPSATLSTPAGAVTKSSPILVNIVWSEMVSGFSAEDVTVTNGAVQSLSGAGLNFQAQILPSSEGTITVIIPQSAAQDAAGNGNASATLSTRYDVTPPTVVSVTSSPSTGAYRAGQQISIQVNFSEVVYATSAVANIELETGVSDASGSYTSGSGTTRLTFLYTIQSGHSSEDLEYLSANSLTLSSGSVRDAAGNNAVLTLAAPGASGSLSANSSVIIDTSQPSVLLSSEVSGETPLDVIPVDIVFSEPVTGFSLASLSVVNGCASNLRGSGTTYRVDIVPRAHGAVQVSVLAFRSSDRAGNGNVASSNTLEVTFYTDAPKITSVSSSTPDGAYRAGATISIQVSFSEEVTVTGTPQMKLATGSIATVNYTSGSGSPTLVFSYTVASGQNSADLDYTALPALILNGGSIKDSNTESFDVARTFACPGTAGSLAANKNIVIDTIAPTIARVTSTTSNGAYRASQTLNVRAVFSETVYVEGQPQMTLETGPTDAVISMSGGSGTPNLDFPYTIETGHNSARLNYVSVASFNLNQAVIYDLAGNMAVTTLPSLASANSLSGQKALVVDTIPPQVSFVSSSSTNGAYKAGTLLSIEVRASETVYVSGQPRLQLATSVANRFALYGAGSGSGSLTFTYTVASGDTSEDLDYLSSEALTTNGGTVRDLAGNDGVLTLAAPGSANSLSYNKNLILDTSPASVVRVSAEYPKTHATIGDVVPINVSFSEPVFWNLANGYPSILLNSSGTASARYVSGGGSATQVFSYTVAASENTPRLDYTSSAALLYPSPGTNTFIDRAGNVSDVTLPRPGDIGSLGYETNIVVDTLSPTVTSVRARASNGSYRAGQYIEIEVATSEPLYGSASSTLILETGVNDQTIPCVSTQGVTVLTCSYTVVSGDTTADLDYISTAALGVAAPGLTDIAGNLLDSRLPSPGGLNSLGWVSDVVIDTTAPTIVLSSTTTPYTNLSPIPISVSASEPITGISAGSFSVTNGSIQGINGSGATYSLQVVPAGQGEVSIQLIAGATLDRANNSSLQSNKLARVYDSVRPTFVIESSVAQRANQRNMPATITFSEEVSDFTSSDLRLVNGVVRSFSGEGASYQVEISATEDGEVTVDVPAGVAFDRAGNSSQGGDTFLKTFDSRMPMVTSIDFITPNGFYGVGTRVEVSVHFSESVQVHGNPRLKLRLGEMVAQAAYVSGDGTDTLRLAYEVESEHNSSDLDYLSSSAFEFEVGGIEDAALNSADPTLPPPGSPGSLSVKSDIVIDTASPEAPAIESPGPDTIALQPSITIAGQTEPHASVDVINGDDALVCSTVADERGAWRCSTPELADGDYSVSARATDRALNKGDVSPAISFTIARSALFPPTVTSPRNGFSAQRQPAFAGTCPRGAIVKVRLEGRELCESQVARAGAWSCASRDSLLPGRYEITAVSVDPQTNEMSAETLISLAVGQNIEGLVVMSNRQGSPLQGVEISDGGLSSTTDASGIARLGVVDPSDTSIVARKYGWRIERASNVNEYPVWISTPRLEPDSYAFWGGVPALFRQRLELINTSAKTTSTSVTMYSATGSLYDAPRGGEVGFQATSIIPIQRAARGDKASGSEFGLMKITVPNARYEASLSSERPGDRGAESASYRARLPVTNAITGATYAFYDNSFSPVRGTEVSGSLRNVLLLANLEQSARSFVITRFDRGGSAREREFVSVEPFATLSRRVADGVPGQANGLVEVIATDPSAKYVATLFRHGKQTRFKGVRVGAFLTLDTLREGSPREQFARVQYIPSRRVIQYAEIANTGPNPINIRLTRVGDRGERQPSIPLHLKPKETRRIRLSRLLAKYEEGVLEVSGDSNGAALIQNVIKQYKPNRELISTRNQVVSELFGDLRYDSYDPHAGTPARLSLVSVSDEPTQVTLSCFGTTGQIGGESISLAPRQRSTVPLEGCFADAPKGFVEVNSSRPGAILSELSPFSLWPHP